MCIYYSGEGGKCTPRSTPESYSINMRLFPGASLLLSGKYFLMLFGNKQIRTYYRLDTKFASRMFSATIKKSPISGDVSSLSCLFLGAVCEVLTIYCKHFPLPVDVLFSWVTLAVVSYNEVPYLISPVINLLVCF